MKAVNDLTSFVPGSRDREHDEHCHRPTLHVVVVVTLPAGDKRSPNYDRRHTTTSTKGKAVSITALFPSDCNVRAACT